MCVCVVWGLHLALFYLHVELSALTNAEDTHMHTPIKGSLLYLTLIDKNTHKQTPHLIISIKVRLSRLLTVCGDTSGVKIGTERVKRCDSK